MTQQSICRKKNIEETGRTELWSRRTLKVPIVSQA